MPVGALRMALEERYGWALDVDFERPEARALFWYHSAEKEEPRLGFRYEEPGAERELRLGIGLQAAELHRALDHAPDPTMPVGRFLLANPGFRQIVRRVQSLGGSPFAEIHDNLLDRGCEPVDLLRGKLAMFGASRFDPKSLLWTRVTFFQGAPLADELERSRRRRLGIRNHRRRCGCRRHRVMRERCTAACASPSRSCARPRAVPSLARAHRPAPSATAPGRRSGSSRAVFGGPRPSSSDLRTAAVAGLRPPDLHQPARSTSRAARFSSGGAASSSWRCWKPEPPSSSPAAGRRVRSFRRQRPRRIRGWRFRLRAGESEALVSRDVIALDRSFASLEAADVRIVAEKGSLRAGHSTRPSPSRLNTAQLESRHCGSLATGLRLDPDDWQAIRQAAARILVPASERSRSRGAGAEVDDNV